MVAAHRDDVSITDAVELYYDDLPSLHCMQKRSSSRWKQHWIEVNQDESPDTIAKALKVCDSDMYLNLSILLQIYSTITVTS